MDTVVALFPDQLQADHAVERLLANDVQASQVHLHEKDLAPRNAAGVVADEYMTGGFFNNFLSLLDGLMNTPRNPGTVRTYAEVVQHEGVAVSVEVVAERAAAIEELLRAIGASHVSRTAPPVAES